jgi:hypothetical protein
MTPQQFIGKWRRVNLTERSACQQHFLDLCELLGQALRNRIAAAAVKLNDLRENWLNPKNPDGSPAMTETQLKKRTLTNLYNDRPTWPEPAHLELDRAVLTAYGWPEDWAEKLQPKRDEKGKVNPILGVADPATEQEVLACLPALNLTMSEPGRKR